MADDPTSPADAAPEPSTETAAEAAAPTAAEGAQAELAKLKDDLLRALAETENVRRRGERAAAEARLFAVERFAKDLLPIADHLTRALESAAELDALREGVALTHATLLDTFARHGLKPVGAAGDRFDPNLHQAIAQAPSEAPAGSVIEVMQQGWTLNDRTIRAAMVAVSAGGGGGGPSGGDAGASSGEPGATLDVSA